jgi:hypothetical protein
MQPKILTDVRRSALQTAFHHVTTGRLKTWARLMGDLGIMVTGVQLGRVHIQPALAAADEISVEKSFTAAAAYRHAS